MRSFLRPLLLLLAGCGASAPPPAPAPPPSGAGSIGTAVARPTAAVHPPSTQPARGQPVPPAPGFALSIAPPPPIFAGSKQALWAGTPGKGLRWQTSDPEVAAVDSTGVVHAIGPGVATITATLALPDGSEETASTAVTVKANPLQDSGRGHRVRRH